MTIFSPIDTMSFFILMTLCVIIDRPQPFLCIETLICKDTDDNSLQDRGCTHSIATTFSLCGVLEIHPLSFAK